MTFRERQLRIAGVLDNVSVACEFVAEQARAAGLDERSINHCYLAVDEACTNIVEHGYGAQCDNCVIDLFCRQDTDALTITIIDDSRAFDPLVRPDPDPNQPINERGVGGWGIFFIKKMMDKVTYSYEGSRNHLVMVKNINKPPQVVPRPEPPIHKPIEVVALSEKIWMITPSGRLDATQTDNWESTLIHQLAAYRHWLILNMADVDYISSAGLKMLVRVWQRIRDQKGDLVLTALKPRVREVLEMIGLDLVFTIADTPDQAHAYIASKVK
jgi:anti-anti-sigma factor